MNDAHEDMSEVYSKCCISYPKPGKKKKKKRGQDKKYQAFIRSQICLICGSPETVHHHESLSGSGVGIKCPDNESLPLCYVCHHERHHYGRRSFYQGHEVNYIEKILKYQLLYDKLKGKS